MIFQITYAYDLKLRPILVLLKLQVVISTDNSEFLMLIQACNKVLNDIFHDNFWFLNYVFFDQSIGSTETKYIKLNTKTPIFFLITFDFVTYKL